MREGSAGISLHNADLFAGADNQTCAGGCQTDPEDIGGAVGTTSQTTARMWPRILYAHKPLTRARILKAQLQPMPIHDLRFGGAINKLGMGGSKRLCKWRTACGLRSCGTCGHACKHATWPREHEQGSTLKHEF